MSTLHRIDAERQFSLGIVNDAFRLGYHCWWLVGFVLSFGLFTVVLGFVSGVLDNRPDTFAPPPGNSASAASGTRNLKRFMRNLDETNPDAALATMDRLSRLEGARRSLGYPLLRDLRQDSR